MTEMKPKTTAKIQEIGGKILGRLKKTLRAVAIWVIFIIIIAPFLPYVGWNYFWPGGILDAAELLGQIIGIALVAAIIAFPCFFLFWPPNSWPSDVLPKKQKTSKIENYLMEIVGVILIGVAIHGIVFLFSIPFL